MLDVNDGAAMEVRWVPGFKNKFAVSCDGRVYEYVFGQFRVLPNIAARGVVKCKFGGRVHLVRNVVAEAFHPNPTKLPCVAHIDGDHANVSAGNLVWVAYSDPRFTVPTKPIVLTKTPKITKDKKPPVVDTRYEDWMPGVEKKWVPGLEGAYAVTVNGDVARFVRGFKEMKKTKTSSGWHVSVKQGRMLHRVVASAFLDNPNKWTYVHFIDGNKYNCAVENLEWGPSASRPIAGSFAAVNLETQTKPKPYPIAPSVKEMMAWLEPISEYISGSFFSAGSRGTIHRRIAHLSKTLGLRELNGHSPVEELEMMIAAAQERIDSGEWASDNVTDIETANSGHIYVLSFDNGGIKVGMTKSGRLGGSTGRLKEHKKTAKRFGCRIIGDVMVSSDMHGIRKVELKVHRVLRELAENYVGEVYHGLDFESVVSIVSRMLDKHTYGEWEPEFFAADTLYRNQNMELAG